MKQLLKTIANRMLWCMASIGMFLFADALGIQQLTADYVQRVSYDIKTK